MFCYKHENEKFSTIYCYQKGKKMSQIRQNAFFIRYIAKRRKPLSHKSEKRGFLVKRIYFLCVYM